VFTRWERLQLFVAAWIGYFAVLLIGRSLRWRVMGWENWEAARAGGREVIFTFWHREIFPALWFWRRRGIAVMTSQSFDGELIARIIERSGYVAVRGSSSRGATHALVEMIRFMRQGHDTGVTTDGPRGPRFVAKPGSVVLAKATGAPILCFHMVPEHAWVFPKSWDQFELPRPFTSVAVFITPPLWVEPDADTAVQARRLQDVQATLEGLMRKGETN